MSQEEQSSSNDDSDSNNVESHTVNSPSKTSNAEKPFKATFCVEDLTEDDEIYTLQCPDSFNIKDLCSKSFNKISKDLEIDIVETQSSYVTLALPSKKKGGVLINAPLKGHIVLHKMVEIPEVARENQEEEEEENIVKFPEDIKVRHPLLGANWESYIEEANKAISRSNSKKVKKSKDRKRKHEDYTDVQIKSECLEEEKIESPKKNKKKKIIN